MGSTRMRIRNTLHTTLLASCCLLGCSSENAGPAEADRTAWQRWTSGYVTAICQHQDACGMPTGAACAETGGAWADATTCDAAVNFYIAHRNELEACTHPYPDSCDVKPEQACPVTADPSFDSLCK